MTPQDAIQHAKKAINVLYAEENITNLGLEEIEFDDVSKQWVITLGFSRPWNSPRTKNHDTLGAVSSISALKRDYKIVTLTEAGEFVSVKKRVTAEADG